MPAAGYCQRFGGWPNCVRLDAQSGDEFPGDCLYPAPSNPAIDHLFLYLGDRLGRVQALGAGLGAVENRVATVKPERVFEIVRPFNGSLNSTPLADVLALRDVRLEVQSRLHLQRLNVSAFDPKRTFRDGAIASPKATVFPEPVCAETIRSRPSASVSSTAACTGVGVT